MAGYLEINSKKPTGVTGSQVQSVIAVYRLLRCSVGLVSPSRSGSVLSVSS